MDASTVAVTVGWRRRRRVAYVDQKKNTTGVRGLVRAPARLRTVRGATQTAASQVGEAPVGEAPVAAGAPRRDPR